MIEKVVLDFLKSKLSVAVAMETPSNPPARYVLIEKTSGGMENGIETATLAVQSYAPSLFEAAKLNEEVKRAMFEILEIDNIFSIELDSNYNFTDISTKKYRYQAVYEITFQGED